ncbi:MAG: TRAP transporter TAXI family solute receptor [Natronomonas sp.]|jgi:TRAP transporter TAXI family solute receptor
MDHELPTTRRAVLGGIAATTAIGLAGCTSGSDGETTVRMGGGPQGTATFASSQALQKVVSDHGENVSISTQETSDTGVSNFRLYDNGEIDAGGFDNFVGTQAAAGTDAFEDAPVSELPLQGFFYVLAHLYIVTPADSDIETTDDLAGRRVWLNPPGTSIRVPTDAVFRESGLYEDIEIREMGRSDLPGAIEEGRVDAAVVYGVNFKTLPGWVSELDSRFELRAVELTDAFREAIDRTGGTAGERIEAYGWSQDIGTEELDTWNVVGQFRFGDQLSEAAVEEITRIAHEHNDEIIEANAIFPSFEDPAAMTNGVIPDQPIHPGVAAYWRELGVWNDEWTVGSLE